MMDYWTEAADGRFVVYAGDRLPVCTSNSLRDAALIRQSLSFLESITDQFPGLLNGEDDVSGADLVEWLSNGLTENQTLAVYLAGEGDYKGDEEIYDPATDTSTIRPGREL